MGYALADDVVERDEAAFGVERPHHGGGETLDAGAERGHHLIGHIGERFIMGQRHQQHMAEHQRPVIQEGEANVVPVDGETFLLPGDDRAEFTGSGDPPSGAGFSRGHRKPPQIRAKCTSFVSFRQGTLCFRPLPPYKPSFDAAAPPRYLDQ